MPEKFSASVASRHMQCHGSANLDLAIPGWTPPVEDPTKDNAANRGTRMHEMFADIVSLSTTDMTMMARALQYVAEVRAKRRFKVLSESVQEATWLASAPGDVPKTTADLVLYVADEIHVIDLKTGRIPVQTVGNSQLLYYAATYAHLAPRAKGVTVHIVQPWAGIMDSWWVDTPRLAQFMADARAAYHAIQNLSTKLFPGDHCEFCPAYPHSRTDKGKPLCPAAMQLLYPAPFNEDEILNS